MNPNESLLVIASAKPGEPEHIGDAFPIPNDWTSNRTPLQVLEYLADTCGAFIGIGSEEKKFYLKDFVPMAPGGRFEVVTQGHQEILAAVHVQYDNERRGLHVAIGYAINPHLLRAESRRSRKSSERVQAIRQPKVSPTTTDAPPAVRTQPLGVRLRFALIAGEAERAPDGRLNIIGQFDQVFAERFPFAFPKAIVLAARFEAPVALGADHQVEFALYGSDGELISGLMGPEPIRFIPTGASRPLIATLIVHIQGLVFPRPDQYELRITVNEKVVGRVPLDMQELANPKPPLRQDVPS